MANGTEAIELILLGLGIGPGDEVIVPSATFVATVEAVHNVGAVPVFADSLAESVLIDLESVESLISARSAALIVVHLYGIPVDPGPLVELCNRHGLALIEDAAQAHGAKWGGQPVGSFGNAASFSFYPTKNLGALGDGGAVVTDDDELARRVKEFSRHGRSEVDADHSVVGRNSRLDAVQAAALDLKLDHLDAWVSHRRAAADRYRTLLGAVVQLEPETPAEAEPVWHLFPIYVPDRDALGAALGDVGVQTGVHYAAACHLWPCFSDLEVSALPHSERWFASELSLPMHSFITDAEIDAVAERLLPILQRSA